MTVDVTRAPTTDLGIERRDGVTTLCLDRDAKRNALSATLVEDLITAVTTACRDATRLLVLRGAGRCFSAGFDFTDYTQQSEGDLALRFVRLEQLLQAVEHAPMPTLALVHGKTFGAGVDLAAACTHRVVAPDTRLRMPGLRFGLVLGSRRLAARTSEAWAHDVLSRTRTIDEAEAHDAGLATQIAPQQEWEGIVAEIADQARQLDPATTATLRSRLVPDTRADDMLALVRSVAEPGLVERIRHFREETR